MTPYGVKSKVNPNETINVPCGKCPACFARRTSGWSFRLLQEDKISKSSYFITLTYDTSNVPISPNGFMSLSKRDVQLFFKRLRKAHTDAGIKYYAVGEYGGKSFRPHYHLLLFNAKIELIQPAWDLGNIHYGKVTGASVGYTLKYMSKVSRIPMHCNDDRVPEFGLMSKGLGANYLTDNMVKWHKDVLNLRMYCNLPDGKKISMPRYYKDKIYTEDERSVIAFFTRQKMLLELEKKEQNPNYYIEKFYADEAAFRKMKNDYYKPEKNII